MGIGHSINLVQQKTLVQLLMANVISLHHWLPNTSPGPCYIELITGLAHRNKTRSLNKPHTDRGSIWLRLA